MLKDRILKGISYFRPITPSKWTLANTVQIKTLLDLMEEYVNGAEIFMKDKKEIENGQ
jgi:hypothetical protein